MKLTQSVRKVVYAMSWAAFIFLNYIQCEEKETYGFRSQKPMPNVEELKDFKDACVDLIGGIKWRRNASNPLQRKLLLNGIKPKLLYFCIFRNLKEEFVPSAKVTWDIDTSRKRAGVIKIQRLTLSPLILCLLVKLSESPRSSKRFAFKTEY